MATQPQVMFEAPASYGVDYSNPYFNSDFEDEWEATHETHYSNPYSNPEYEDEWESHEAHYSNPHSNSEFEDEWEASHQVRYSNPYTSSELEADQFFFLGPLIAAGAKLASKLALKGAGKLAFKLAKKAISKAPKLLNKINKVQQFTGDRPTPSRQLPRQPNRVLREGEMETAALEAEFFGSNEFEGELAHHAAAHEIALTELLAHEAAQSESEQEAEYLLKAALPITIRIMSGSAKMPRQISPSLLQANARLVQGFYRQGRDGRQLLQAAPTITRRALASMRAIRKRGGHVTPEIMAQIMAAHTARVLSTPGILGPALVRNFAIRRSTSLPVRQLLRLPQRQQAVRSY
jgi:hypothetical protein